MERLLKIFISSLAVMFVMVERVAAAGLGSMSPRVGDKSQIFLYIALMAVSLLGFAALLVYLKKNKNKE